MLSTVPIHPEPAFALPAGLDPDSAEAVQRFVAAHTFPSANDGRYLLAFADADNQLATVRVRHGLIGHRLSPVLHRCTGGLHILELTAPFVNRLEYRFATLDHEGVEAVINDPLNPHSVRDPFAQKSVLATAAYAPPAYVATPPKQARGELHEIHVTGPLGKPWPAWVWSPPSVDRSTVLPVIVFLDGRDWLQLASARNILENLIFSGEMRPCRAVFLRPASRNEEFAANPATAGFLAHDLPRIASEHIPWPTESRSRVAIGCSLAGVCLLHTHFTQPNTFGGLILQSGSFFQPHTDAMESGFEFFEVICDFVSRALGSAARSIPRIPIHMTAGLGEENYVNNAVLAEALTRQGFALTFHKQPDAHNWTCWRDSVGAGLRRLLSAE